MYEITKAQAGETVKMLGEEPACPEPKEGFSFPTRSLKKSGLRRCSCCIVVRTVVWIFTCNSRMESMMGSPDQTREQNSLIDKLRIQLRDLDNCYTFGVNLGLLIYISALN